MYSALNVVFSLYHWVTIRKARDMYIRHSRTPLPEIYSRLSTSRAPVKPRHPTGIGAVSALGGVEVS